MIFDDRFSVVVEEFDLAPKDAANRVRTICHHLSKSCYITWGMVIFNRKTYFKPTRRQQCMWLLPFFMMSEMFRITVFVPPCRHSLLTWSIVPWLCQITRAYLDKPIEHIWKYSRWSTFTAWYGNPVMPAAFLIKPSVLVCWLRHDSAKDSV